MPFVHGRNAAFYLADSGATQRNLTAFLDNVDVSWDQDASETTTLGSSGRSYVQGLYTGTISLAGKWDNAGTGTPDQWLSGLFGGTVTSAWVYAPNGSASGRPYETGSAVITNYTVTAPVDDVVTFSASLQATGTITRATF